MASEFPQDQEKTKKQLQDLNARFSKYIENVQNLERQIKNSEELSSTTDLSTLKQDMENLKNDMEQLKTKNKALNKRLKDEIEERKKAENDRDALKEKEEDANVEVEVKKKQIESLKNEINFLKKSYEKKISRLQTPDTTDGSKTNLVSELKDIRNQYDAIADNLYRKKMDDIDQMFSDMKMKMMERLDEYKSLVGKELDLKEEIDKYNTLMLQGETSIKNSKQPIKTPKNPATSQPKGTQPQTSDK